MYTWTTEDNAAQLDVVHSNVWPQIVYNYVQMGP